MSTEFLGKHVHSSLPHTGEPNIHQKLKKKMDWGIVLYEVDQQEKGMNTATWMNLTDMMPSKRSPE